MYVANAANISPHPNRPGRRCHPNNGNMSQNRGGRNQMAPNELLNFKMRSKCTAYGNQGNWADENMNDDTIRDGIP